ncbi:MAG TPA: tRNA (adenosine(37)-N6)-threonylcarbamoyltransferase complex dimerization subunit type 1 TsaB, partial [Paracoccus sp. (in: a-proteobacteria)]|nr:tRNA (adenosine(37)-N6)-threonylcarbamoyltransferase complex dimerization subunit type 1 TsaB [Paracoccus sp. (in: a-proteobacteria)]
PAVAEPRDPLAGAVARIAAERAVLGLQPRPAPLYLRPADAAPPRDLPPRVLP